MQIKKLKSMDIHERILPRERCGTRGGIKLRQSESLGRTAFYTVPVKLLQGKPNEARFAFREWMSPVRIADFARIAWQAIEARTLIPAVGPLCMLYAAKRALPRRDLFRS